MSCVPEPTTETLTLLQEALTRIADFTVADTRQNQMALVSMTEEVERLCGKLLPVTFDELKELDESNLSVKKKYESYKGTILSILRPDAGCTLSTIAQKLHRAVLDSELLKTWDSLHTYSALCSILSVFSLLTRFCVLFNEKNEKLKAHFLGDSEVFIYITSTYVKDFDVLSLENKTNQDLSQLHIFVRGLTCAIRALDKGIPRPDNKFIREHLDRSFFDTISKLYEISSDQHIHSCCVIFLYGVVEGEFDINCAEYEKCIERICFSCRNSLLCNACGYSADMVENWFNLLEAVIDKAVLDRYRHVNFIRDIQQNAVWPSLAKYVSSRTADVAVAAIKCAGGILLGSQKEIESLVHSGLFTHLTLALYSNDELVTKNALWLLSNLATEHDFLDVFKGYDWLRIILHHIRAKNPIVTIEGLWVLLNFLLSSDNHIAEFLKIDQFVETIKMSLYAPQEQMQPPTIFDWRYLELLLECVSTLWRNSEAREILIKFEVKDAVKYILEEKNAENYDADRVGRVRDCYRQLYVQMVESEDSHASSVTSTSLTA